MKRTFLLTSLCLIVLASLVMLLRAREIKAQIGPVKIQTSSHVKWDSAMTPITLADNKLHIKLNKNASKSNWKVGVHVDNGMHAKITAGTVTTVPDSRFPGGRKIDALAKFQPDSIILKEGLVEYVGGDVGEGVVVYVLLPIRSQLQIDIGGETVFMSTVSTDVIIDARGATQQFVKNIGMLAFLASLPGPGPFDASDIVTTGSGAKVASFNGLKSHLKKSVRARYPEDSQIEFAETVALRITIDIAGNVTDIAPASGKAPFINSCTAAVREWKFSPFIEAGAPISVTGMVNAVFATNGTVMMPLLDSAFR